jgi:predicted outer membrane protein
MKPLATAALALLTAVLCAGAVPAGVAAQTAALSARDLTLGAALRDVARGQIEMASYARTHAKSGAVRSLAAAVASEWGNLEARLAPMVPTTGRPATDAIASGQARMFAELRATAAEDFDAAYVRVAFTDVDRAIGNFTDATRDPQLQSVFREAQPGFTVLDELTSRDPAGNYSMRAGP